MFNILKNRNTLIIGSSLLTFSIIKSKHDSFNKEIINDCLESIYHTSKSVFKTKYSITPLVHCLEPTNNKTPSTTSSNEQIPEFPMWASTFSSECNIPMIEKRTANQMAAKELIAWKEQNLIPGVTATVMVRGETVWQSHLGYSDIENGVNVTEATKMRIASISKSLTSAAVGILVDDNKLDLDAPISQYEGDSGVKFPTNPNHPDKPLTVRYLASHLSGIRHYRTDEKNEFYSVEKFQSDRYSNIPPPTVPTFPTPYPADLQTTTAAGSTTPTTSNNNNTTTANKKYKHPLEIFSVDPWITPKEKSEPGQTFNYTTFGYTLLGTVIERISQQDYLTFMKKRVFEKCGMSSTLPDYHDQIISNRSKQYSLSEGKSPQLVNAEFTNSSYKWAGGGFCSTSKDICKFGTGLISGHLVKRQTLEKMFTPQTLKSGQKTKYGIGWFIIPNPVVINPTESLSDKVIYHTGGAVGGSTLLLMLPYQGVVVSILTNRQEVKEIQNIGVKIANIFSEHYQCKSTL